MYSFSFLLSHLCQYQAITFQFLRTILVFLSLYLLFFFPSHHLGITKEQTLFILQFISVLTVFIQAAPLFDSDINDGSLEKWLANQGAPLCYLMAQYIAIFFKVILPLSLLLCLFLYPLDGQMTAFLGVIIVNIIIATLWCGNISLLLASKQEGGTSIIGMILVGLVLIPQLLMGQEVTTEIFMNSIAISHIALYCGLSLLNIALSLALAPFIVCFSVNN